MLPVQVKYLFDTCTLRWYFGYYIATFGQKMHENYMFTVSQAYTNPGTLTESVKSWYMDTKLQLTHGH